MGGTDALAHPTAEVVRVRRTSARVVRLSRFPRIRELHLERGTAGTKRITDCAGSGLEKLVVRNGTFDLSELGESRIKSFGCDTPPSALTLPETLREAVLEFDVALLDTLHLPSGLRRLTLLRAPESFAFGTLTELTYLKLWLARGLVNLERLAPLRSLRQLTIDHAPMLQSLAGLSAKHEALHTLSIRHAPLASLDWRAAPPLRTLKLHGVEVRSIAGLPTSLTRLRLDECSALVDVSPVAACTALKKLSLRGCKKVVDIGALSKLSELESLELKRSGVRRFDQVPDAIRHTVQGRRLRQRPLGVRAAAAAPKAPQAKRALVQKLKRLFKSDEAAEQAVELAVALDDAEVEAALLGGVRAGFAPRVEVWRGPGACVCLPDPAPVLVPNDVFDGGAAGRWRRETVLRLLVARVGGAALRDSITALTLSGHQTRKKRYRIPLRGIGRFERLETLHLIHAPGLEEVSALADARALRRLFCEDVRIEQVPVAPQLTHLACLGSRIQTLAGIGEASGLEWLRLGGRSVRDLSPIAHLAQLRTLHLQGANTSLAPLRALQLTEFILEGFFHDTQCLRDMSTLERVHIWGGMADLEAIASLPRLRSLRLDLNQKTFSLKPFLEHPTLEDLTLCHASLGRSDATVIEGLPALRRLGTVGTTFGGHRFSKRIRDLRQDPIS